MREDMLKNIFYIALIILSIIGFAASAVSLYVSTRVTLGTVLPGCTGLLLGAYAVLHLRNPGPIIQNPALHTAAAIIVCIGLAVFAVVEGFIIARARADTNPPEADYAIVLGCGILKNGQPTSTLRYRLDAAYDYMLEYPDALCVVTGGQGSNEPMPEAVAMKAYLVNHGINASRILAEAESTDTKENITNAMAVMKAHDPDRDTAVVVTSDFHVFRAEKLAKKCGLEAVGIATPTPWYIAINCYMREFVGVLKMLLID